MTYSVIKLFWLSLISVFFTTNLCSNDDFSNFLGQPHGKHVLFFDKETTCLNQDIPIAFSLTYSSKYIWRGLNLVDDSVLQPEFSLSKYGWNVAIWGNVDATNVHGHAWEFSEVDGTIAYSDSVACQWTNLNYCIGATYYTYPTGYDLCTCEVFLGVEINSPLNPTIAVYYDVDKAKGWYITYGIHHHWDEFFCPLQDFAMGIDIAASIGSGSSDYNDYYYSYDSISFLDVQFCISLPSRWRCWQVTPFFAGSYLTDESIRHRVYPNKNFWGGASVSRRF